MRVTINGSGMLIFCSKINYKMRITAKIVWWCFLPFWKLLAEISCKHLQKLGRFRKYLKCLVIYVGMRLFVFDRMSPDATSKDKILN